MSSYLNFYLRPKNDNGKDTKPLLLCSYCRISPIYSIFVDTLTIPSDYDGVGLYKELTIEMLKEVLSSINKSIETNDKISEENKDRQKLMTEFVTKVSALTIEKINDATQIKNLLKASIEALNESIDENDSLDDLQEYSNELTEAKTFVSFCINIIDEFDIASDFEALMVNIC